MFVDTNVFAYALDETDQRKQGIAKELLRKHSAELVISTQVMIELYSVCIGKLGIDAVTSRAAVESAANSSVVPTDRELILDAVSFAQLNRLSIFDAAIVCAAIRAGCELLFTEDMNDGQVFGNLTVSNPFAN